LDSDPELSARNKKTASKPVPIEHNLMDSYKELTEFQIFSGLSKIWRLFKDVCLMRSTYTQKVSLV